MHCQSLTRKGHPCPNGDATADADGVNKCHIHRSGATFRLQVAARREDRAAGRLPTRAERIAAAIAPKEFSPALLTMCMDTVYHTPCQKTFST